MVPVGLLVQAAEAKSIAARFREAGATEPGKAMAWAPAGKMDEMNFKSLFAKGALVGMRPGTWYLNEEKLSSAGAVQAPLIVAALAMVALLAGMLLLLRAA